MTYIDLPTSHWPMWSKPADIARIIGDVATRAGGRPLMATLLDDAFAHHVWATERLLDVCDGLTPEQLARRRCRAPTARSSTRSSTWSAATAGT